MKKERTGVFLGLILVVAVFLSAPTGQFRLSLQNGAGLIAGRNVNMVSGQKLPYGDPFLQRQNEPSIAVSTRNPMHLLAGANDYRTVDWLIPYEELPGPPEGAAASRDAWLGVYKSFNGGQDWQSGLLAGFPQDNTAEGLLSPLKAYGTAADPVVRAGTNGLFYMSGIAFNRNAQGGGLFIARFIDNNNKEKGDTIKYLGTAVLDKCTPGQFIDKPWLAVDLPRSGPDVIIDGQEIPPHNVYVAYTVFVGNSGDNVRSKVLVARSTNCGLSWGQAVKLSESQHINQGVTMAVDPRNNGVLYVAWRRFAHGSDPSAILVCRSVDGGQTYTKPVAITTLTPFDQGSTEISFRTNSYPSLAVDHNGLVYAAWSQRPAGDLLGMAKVFMSASSDGAAWSTPMPIDATSEGQPVEGHQVMPSLTYAMGRIVCVWYDQRRDVSGRFSQWIDDTPGKTRHTLDVRAAEILLGTTSLAKPTIQVSRYLWFIKPDNTAVQAQYSRPNYPLFKEGTRAFYGDYIDLAPAPMFVTTANGGWIYNMNSDQTPVFHAAWTDNRDVRQPIDGDWSHYTPPTSTQEGPFGSSITCEFGHTSIRNQNVYTATLTGGLVVGSPGNHKSLGPNPEGEAIQHTFVVYVKNLTKQPRSFRLTIEAPMGVEASFLQGSDLDTLDVTIAPASSIARTVYAYSATNPDATIQVLVKEISTPGGGEVSGGLNGSVILNPDIENPDIENPDIENPDIENPDIENYEVHNPDIENPAIENPDIENFEVINPDIENPDIENTDIVNPDIENPDIENPDIENPDIENLNIMNPDIENPTIGDPSTQNGALKDYTWRVKNIGNTASSYRFRMISAGFEASSYPGFGFQLLIYRVYTSPVSANCILSQEHHDELLANIVGPDIINPDIENPDIENPDIENPDIENATFWLAPGDEALITLRVYDPNKNDGITFNVNSVAGVTTAQSVNSQDELVGRTVPPIDSPLPSLTIYNSSLPAGTVGTFYTADLIALDGTPQYAWSIDSGSLPPGISLYDSAGVLSGTPTAAGTFSFTVKVTDSAEPQANTATKALSITIAPPPAPPANEWVAIYNGPGNAEDKVGGTEIASTSCITYDWAGNVYVTGQSAGSGGAGPDIATIKYNSSGVQQWVARYNGPNNDNDYGRAIAVDSEGSVYVAGYSYNSVTQAETGVIIKYSSQGLQLWARQIGTMLRAIALDPAGNVIVAGYVAAGPFPNYDFVTVKYDSQGTQQWIKTYDEVSTVNENVALDIAVDGSGNVYVTGWCNYNPAGNIVGRDFATVKYNSAGAQQWVRTYNGSANDGDVAQSVAVDASGNVYVSGMGKLAVTGNDYVTIKYDSAGAQQWIATYNGAGSNGDMAYDVAVDGSGNVYVTGSSSNGTDTDFATIKYNSNGQQQYAARYNGPGNGNEVAVALGLDSSGNIYVVGRSAGSGTGNDIATVKYDSQMNELWVRRYDGEAHGADEASGLAVDAYGYIYVGGGSTGSNTGVDYCTIKYLPLHGKASDPAGDAYDDNRVSPDPDLVAATGTVRGDTLALRVEFAAGTFSSASSVAQFSLDTDANPSTGHPGVDSGNNDSSLMGTDFLVNMYPFESPPVARVLKYSGQPNTFSQVGSCTLFISGSAMGAMVPLSLLDNDDGRLNFKVTSSAKLPTSGYTGVLDYMTNLTLPPGKIR